MWGNKLRFADIFVPLYWNLSFFRLNMLKTKTISRLRQALFDESNNIDPELGNPYGVQPKEFKSNHDNLQCDLYSRLKTAKTLRKSDISGRIRDAIPPNDIFSNTTTFNNCAIVTSAGSLHHSNLGTFIGKRNRVKNDMTNHFYKSYFLFQTATI